MQNGDNLDKLSPQEENVAGFATRHVEIGNLINTLALDITIADSFKAAREFFSVLCGMRLAPVLDAAPENISDIFPGGWREIISPNSLNAHLLEQFRSDFFHGLVGKTT